MTTALVAEDRTRLRLVETAASCFAEHGIQRVSLEEVATRAGMHRTTLHRHFPGGRDELVIAVLQHESDQVIDTLAAQVAQAPSAREAIVAAVTAAVAEGRRSRVAASLLAESATREALFGPAATQLRETALGLWHLMAERAAPGERLADVPADRALDHVFRVVVSLVSEPGAVRTDEDVRRYAEDFVAPALVAT